MPHDVASAYINASVRDGGLGISNLKWTAPLLRLSRLRKLRGTALTGNNNFLEIEIAKCEKRLLGRGLTYGRSEYVRRRWALCLYGSINGRGLKESDRTEAQHRWVAEGTRFLTGRDFVNSIRLRICALPTRSCTSRGRHMDRSCRAGCYQKKTLNHVLQ